MSLAAGIALFVVFAAVALVLTVRRSRRASREPIAVVVAPEEEPVEPTLPQPEIEPEITWTVALTPTPLDEAGRLALIEDLALLAAPWTIALLRRAYLEESSPWLRARIEAALAASGAPTGPTS